MLIEIAHAAEAIAQEAAKGPAAVLGLDLKLFIAQIINFAIVLLVLWKWAYKPLVKKLNDRTAKIEKGLSDAEAAAKAREDAERMREERISRAKVEASEVLSAAHQAAEEQGQLMVEETKVKAGQIIQEAKDLMAKEKKQMQKELEARTVDIALVISEKILREKIDEKRDKQLIETIIKNKASYSN